MEKQRLSAEIILCKNNASESNESLFSDCRAQPVLWKNSASKRNKSLFFNCRKQYVLYKKNNFQLFTATCQMTACHTDKPDDNTNKHKYKIHSDNYFDDSNGFL